jgi:adenylate cyclase class 2
MPTETEVKLKVEDLESVRRRLGAVGAAHVGKVMETNRIFDSADRSLHRAGKALRVRSSVGIGSNESTHIMTFKGPRQRGPLKIREELEVEVGDAAEAAAILRALGYVVALSFEKRRETWTLGGCKVELDELPHLGTFVEIEGPDEQVIMQVRRQLQLDGRPTITEAYVGLLMDYLKSHWRGRGEQEIRF